MSKRKLEADDLLRLKFVSDVQIAPSGDRAVFAVKTVRAPGAYRSNLHIWESGSEERVLLTGDQLDVSPRWSPDGRLLAFLSNRATKWNQVFVLDPAGGEPRQLTDLPEGSVSSLRWSPDGTALSIQYAKKWDDRTKAATDARKEADESEPPLTIEGWPYRMDGEGYFESDPTQLLLVSLSDGGCRPLYTDVQNRGFSYCWSPDGRRIALAIDERVQPYLEPNVNEVMVLDVGTGSRHAYETPFGYKSALSFSPSGQCLAMVFCDRTIDGFGPKREHVAVLDLASGTFKVYGGHEDLFLSSHALGDCREGAETALFWSPDESSIVFQHGEQGRQGVARLVLETDQIVRLTPDFVGEIHVGSSCPDGRSLGVWFTTPSAPCEAATLALSGASADLIPLSNLNAALLDEVEVSVPEEVWIETSEGGRLHGWIHRPQKGGAPNASRAVVEVHGGPMAMYTSAFFFEMQLLATQGMCVAFSNPRGSTGYGEDHARCIKGAWGQKDWEDVQALTEHVCGLPEVDPKQVCIAGGSYGGFMVNWAISHSDRYLRAVTDRCVSNLLSKWGNSDYLFVPDGHWPGRAFGDYETLWECSPIKHFSSVRTPTLVIHSEGDLRCNIEQGEQVYAALKILGVETRFVRYPRSTSHGMSRSGPPDLRVHRLKEIVRWLTK